MNPRYSVRFVGLMLAALMTLAYAGQSVPDRAEDINPLKVGEMAPAFEAMTPAGDTFSFEPGATNQASLVIFYRGGWCPYCNRQLKELRETVPVLKEAGVQVLFLSADRPELLASSLDVEVPDYTLLSDASMAISRSFGIAFKVDEKTLKKYKRHGIDLQAASGFDHYQLPVPAVYLIDASGTIQFAYTDPDYKKRLAPEKILDAAGIAAD